jgi:hypothetical protein
MPKPALWPVPPSLKLVPRLFSRITTAGVDIDLNYHRDY